MINEILSERVDLFDPNMMITIAFDIAGTSDAQIFVDAAKRTFTGFESTLSRIVLIENGSAWYEKLTSSGCSVQITNDLFEDIIRENEKKPFAIENGEMMRIFVKPSDGKLKILILAHHLVGDGKSIIYFIEQMMKESIGERASYQTMRLLNEDTLPKNSGISKMYRLLANFFNHAWKNSGKTFDWTDRKELHATYWREKESVIVNKCFTSGNANHIHMRAKAAQVTVNTWILTALMKTNRRYQSVGLAIDARTDGNRCMSNQATGITAEYTYNDSIPFEENALRLHSRIYAKLNKPSRRYFILHFIPLFTPSLIDSTMMYANGLYQNKISQKLAALMDFAPPKNTTLSVTNLARLDIPDAYRDYKIANLYFIPPVVSYSFQTIGVATTGTGMTVTMHSLTDRCTNEEKQMFSEAMAFLERD